MKLMKNKAITIIVICLLSFLMIMTGVCPTYVRADDSAVNITYSGVIEDLKKDASFNESYYPEKPNDYSLQIIQIAESVNNELFVYVYQPSGQTKNLKACSINTSTTLNDYISFHNYKLEYLNSSSVFFKYKVKNFTVSDDATRYYVITSIYRPFDESIDKQVTGGNTISEIECAVNRQYCFGEINGKPYVNCVDIETIVVTDKFVGFVRYKDGYKAFGLSEACDSHFVAFDTNKPIDKLFEADVYYTKQRYTYTYTIYDGESQGFGKESDEYAYLTYSDKVDYNGGGLFAGTYSWNRIQTVEDFITNENRTNIYHGAIIDVTYGTVLTDTAMEELKGKKWVLRFAETSYSFSSSSGIVREESTFVSDVTILRLKFETNGITYNLGVIDNKQTGSRAPSNEEKFTVTLNERGKLLSLVIMLILLILLLVFLNSTGILPLIVKVIVWIISAPFKFIKWLIDKFRSD